MSQLAHNIKWNQNLKIICAQISHHYILKFKGILKTALRSLSNNNVEIENLNDNCFKIYSDLPKWLTNNIYMDKNLMNKSEFFKNFISNWQQHDAVSFRGVVEIPSQNFRIQTLFCHTDIFSPLQLGLKLFHRCKVISGK